MHRYRVEAEKYRDKMEKAQAEVDVLKGTNYYQNQEFLLLKMKAKIKILVLKHPVISTIKRLVD